MHLSLRQSDYIHDKNVASERHSCDSQSTKFDVKGTSFLAIFPRFRSAEEVGEISRNSFLEQNKSLGKGLTMLCVGTSNRKLSDFCFHFSFSVIFQSGESSFVFYSLYSNSNLLSDFLKKQCKLKL